MVLEETSEDGGGDLYMESEDLLELESEDFSWLWIEG